MAPQHQLGRLTNYRRYVMMYCWGSQILESSHTLLFSLPCMLLLQGNHWWLETDGILGWNTLNGCYKWWQCWLSSNFAFKSNVLRPFGKPALNSTSQHIVILKPPNRQDLLLSLLTLPGVGALASLCSDSCTKVLLATNKLPAFLQCFAVYN